MKKITEHNYRSQIVGTKRQMTLPEPMMKNLRLEPGDFLEFVIQAGRIDRVDLLKPLPIHSLSEGALALIQQATAEIERGGGETFASLSELGKVLRTVPSSRSASTSALRHRVQIVGAKRQITIPESMMHDLQLAVGDFLEFSVVGASLKSVKCLPLVVINHLPDEILELIMKADSEFSAGTGRKMAVEELKATLKGSMTKG